MNIYVNFKVPKTIRGFLIKLFSYKLWHGASPKAVQTFKDKACKIEQCGAGAARSPQDMFDIVNTYFPGTSMKTVLTELIRLHPEGRNFIPSYCSVIRRSVFNYYEYKRTDFPRKSNHPYGWGKLLREEVGIKSMKELYNL